MAYNPSASPSSSSLSRETHLFFCSTLSPTNLLQLGTHEKLLFPLEFHHKKPYLLISLNVSVHQPETRAFSQNSESTEEETATPSKSHIWLSPKNSRDSKRKEKSYDMRSSLVELAKSLDSCLPVEEDISSLLNSLGDKIGEREAVIVLDNMSNTETARLVLNYFLALNYFQKRLKFREVVLYSVTLKVFRKCSDLDGAEKLFDEMLERGVQPNVCTFATMISCANLCYLPEKEVEWFEKMLSFGSEPDEMICSRMILAYERVGNVDAVLSLYNRARSEKWRLKAFAFSSLIKIYGSLGNFDGCLNIYGEMKALGVKPNTSVYHSLLECMIRARRMWQLKNIYRDMVKNGIELDCFTYSKLLRAYAKHGYGEDALALYREMKEKKLQPSVFYYNTVLSTCADAGLTGEALEIFQDMKNSGTTPDSRTFSSLISMYSKSGQVEEAEAKFIEMLESGFKPNIFILNLIIQCYGNAGRRDDVLRTFDCVLESGITRDVPLLGCLLSVMAQAPKEEHGKLKSRIEKANPKLGHFVKHIADGESIGEESFKNEARELFESIGADVKQVYCNSLIDLCLSLDQLDRACELFDLGIALQIFRNVTDKTTTKWSLHLSGLSLGAALTAFHIWMKDITEALENGDQMPSLLGIDTRHGELNFLDKGLTGVFEEHFKDINAPFHEEQDSVGWFHTNKVAVASWLVSRHYNQLRKLTFMKEIKGRSFRRKVDEMCSSGPSYGCH